MAEIAHGSEEELTDQTHTGDTDWFTAATADAGDFVAGGKYLVLCIAQLGGTSSALHIGGRLAHGAVPTVFLGSETRIEPRGTPATYRNQYHYFTVFDQPGGGAEDIIFQIKTFDAGQTVHADTIEIIWIRLDDDLTENVDWVYNEDDDGGAPPELPVAWGTTYASKTWTPGNVDDDWLVLANASYIAGNAAYQTEFRINRDAATEVAPLMSCEPEDPLENHTHTLGRVFTLSDAEHTLAVEGREEDALAASLHHSSRIFALRLNAFQDHGFFWNEAEIAVDAAVEIGNVDLTPTAQHNFFILGQAVTDGGAVLQYGHWMQVGGADYPVGTNGYRDISTYDGTDESPGSDGFIINLAVALQNIDMFGRVSVGPAPMEDRSICVVSMELAAAGGVTVTPPTATLTTATFSPIIKLVVIPPKRTLSLATFTPVLGLSVIPPPLALSLATFAPTISTPRLVTPSTAALSLTAFAPTVLAPRLVTPGVVSLSITVFAPTVTTGGVVVTPGVLTLSLGLFAPTVSTTANVVVIPSVIALSLTTFVPAVTAGEREPRGGMSPRFGAPPGWAAKVDERLREPVEETLGRI